VAQESKFRHERDDLPDGAQPVLHFRSPRRWRACGTEFETREIPNWDRGEILRLTGGAYYQVPVLVHDGRLVYESGADTIDVARYVDATFAAGRLFPERLEGLQALAIEFIENELEARTFKLVDIHYLPTIVDVAAHGMWCGTRNGNSAAVASSNGGPVPWRCALKRTRCSRALR